MCHPEPEGAALAGVAREAVAVPVNNAEEMPATLYSPGDRGENGKGTVLVVHDIYGAGSFYESFAARLAHAGFVALLPNFFFRLGDLPQATRESAFERRAKLDESGTVSELSAAIDWLRTQAEGTQARVGTVGFCMGGNLVLNLAAQRHDLATVSYYAFPAGLPGPLAAPPPMELVEEFHGPILAFWGELDESVGMETVELFAKRVAEQGRTEYEYRQLIYPGVGHGFLSALADQTSLGHEAATHSWIEMLQFFERHLRSLPPEE